MAIYKMKNTVRHYPWGDKKFLPEMLGVSNKDDQPFAELWMGAHHLAPSTVLINNKEIPLSDILDQQGKNSLPFLFKILCAASPLSLQVHPDKKHAEKMFAEENEKGIPLDAFDRNYKDNNHKPEILCALTPFRAMRGFRQLSEILKLFTPLMAAMPRPLQTILEKMKKEQHKNKLLVSESKNSTLKDFFTKLSNLSAKEKKDLINFTMDKINKKSDNSDENSPHFWVKKLDSLYPGDIGVLAPYFLNLIRLAPGEAIFLDAGYIHSYLEGCGIELMANSDNVLRSGLTPKNVDINELLRVVRFESEKTTLVESQGILQEQDEKDNQWTRYLTPAKDFTLLKSEGQFNTTLPGKYARVVLVTEGTVSLKEKDRPPITANKGESLFIPYEERNENSKIVISGTGTVYLALSDPYFTKS